MSEQKTEQKASEKILAEIENLKNMVKLDVMKAPMPVVAKATVTALEHLTGCKDCYAKVEEMMTPVILKKYFEGLKDTDANCINCGFSVKREDSDKEDYRCPVCGYTWTKAREWESKWDEPIKDLLTEH